MAVSLSCGVAFEWRVGGEFDYGGCRRPRGVAGWGEGEDLYWLGEVWEGQCGGSD